MDTLTLPTREEIRAMDGPALAQLVFDAGLAEDALLTQDSRTGLVTIIDRIGRDFRPWENMRQADAIFRQLRMRGWDTETYGYEPGDAGFVLAKRWSAPDGERHRILLYSYWGCGTGRRETTEMMALLRCAVLAVVSMQKGT